jgi:hypothetical protein
MAARPIEPDCQKPSEFFTPPNCEPMAMLRTVQVGSSCAYQMIWCSLARILTAAMQTRSKNYKSRISLGISCGSVRGTCFGWMVDFDGHFSSSHHHHPRYPQRLLPRRSCPPLLLRPCTQRECLLPDS